MNIRSKETIESNAYAMDNEFDSIRGLKYIEKIIEKKNKYVFEPICRSVPHIVEIYEITEKQKTLLNINCQSINQRLITDT